MADALPLVLADMAIRGALLALLMLLALALHRDQPLLAVARIGAALCMGLCVQVISATPLFEDTVPRLWQAPLVAVSVGNAVLFWVFVQALFDDEFALRPLHVLTWLAVAALSGLNCAMLANSASVLAPVTMGVQRALPLVFSILAAFAAARNWRADLVEERRRLRVFIVVTGIVYTLASLAARLASPRGQLSGLTATLDVVGLLVIVLAVAVRMLRMTSSSIFPSPLPGTVLGDRPCELAIPCATSAPNISCADVDQNLVAPEAPVPPDPAEERLAQALQHAMTVERAYREEEMSLSRLATRLDVPEYRLRRLINQRLGFRNFNAYINGFRLDAVRAALVDPARRDLPVLTLALDAGFQSIGPFNRAFKAATGLTPTEFRKDAWGRPGGETSADS